MGFTTGRVMARFMYAYPKVWQLHLCEQKSVLCSLAPIVWMM